MFFFSKKLTLRLIEAEDEEKITYLDFESGPYLKEPSNDLQNLELVHNGVEEYCEKSSTKFNLEWYKDKNNGVGGSLRLDLTIKNLFKEDLSKFYDEEMIQENIDIQYFRPWDYATPEAQCGFVIKPDKIYPSMYYNQAGRASLHSLDLDYHGYTQMALEARVYYHWQRVILHYNGWDLGEQETIDFKKNMPEIFPDWTWKGFIEKYESLRLSNK